MRRSGRSGRSQPPGRSSADRAGALAGEDQNGGAEGGQRECEAAIHDASPQGLRGSGDRQDGDGGADRKAGEGERGNDRDGGALSDIEADGHGLFPFCCGGRTVRRRMPGTLQPSCQIQKTADLRGFLRQLTLNWEIYNHLTQYNFIYVTVQVQFFHLTLNI